MRKHICFSCLFPPIPGLVATAGDIYKKLEAIAVIDQKVMMPMRDGVRLATDIYRPKGNAKVPIVFSRTPYNFNTWGDGEMRTRGLEAAYEAVQRGYAYVVQNERGRFLSKENGIFSEHLQPMVTMPLNGCRNNRGRMEKSV